MTPLLSPCTLEARSATRSHRNGKSMLCHYRVAPLTATRKPRVAVKTQYSQKLTKAKTQNWEIHSRLSHKCPTLLQEASRVKLLQSYHRAPLIWESFTVSCFICYAYFKTPVGSILLVVFLLQKNSKIIRYLTWDSKALPFFTPIHSTDMTKKIQY